MTSIHHSNGEDSFAVNVKNPKTLELDVTGEVPRFSLTLLVSAAKVKSETAAMGKTHLL